MVTDKVHEETRSKRTAILAAARVLFIEKGYEETTIADIARRAGIAVGTVYLYFHNKRDVYSAMAHYIEDVIADIFDDPRLAELPLGQFIDTVIDSLFRVGREHCDLLAFLQMDVQPTAEAQQHQEKHERITSALTTIFERAIERHELAPFNTEFYATMFNMLGSDVLHQCFHVENGEREAMYRASLSEFVHRLLFGPSLREGYPP